MSFDWTISKGLRLLACLLTLILVGCADLAVENTESSYGPNTDDGKADQMGDGSDDGMGTQPDSDDPPLEPPTLSNQYAITSNTWITVVDMEDETDEPDEWTARFTGLVSTKMEDGQIVLRVSPCSVQLPAISGREIESNDRMIQRADPAVLRTDLSWDEKGGRLTTDLGAMVAGVDLVDPVNDAMPTDDDDQRLVDVDEDGRPALTLKISGYRVYVGLRLKMTLDGRFLTDGLIRGNSGLRVDLEVYGDSVPFVNVKSALDEALGKLSLTEERHEFVMVPLQDAVTDCEEIPSAAFEVPTSDPSADAAMSLGSDGTSDEPAPTPAEPAPTPADEN